MVRPFFEGENWHCVDSNLHVRYRMASPSTLLQLGTSKEYFFKSPSIQSIDKRIEASKFSMAILECETSAQIGKGMGIVRGDHFWQLGSIASSSYRNYRWEIVVAFWPKHGLRGDLRVPNFKIFPRGACPQTPLLYSHLSTRCHTSLK